MENNNTELKENQDINTESNSTKQNYPDHYFKPGQSGNPNGRPPMTEAEKLKAKVQRDFAKEYKQSLMEALPLISPVLIAKALDGDMQAIKEVNDRAMGKPDSKTDITSGGEKLPILVKFIDGTNN